MVSKIIGAIILTVGGSFLYIINYLGPIGTMLNDDIEVISGKKAARRRWKNSNGNIIKKFLYFGYTDKIKRRHYFTFICYAISFPICIILCDILIILGMNVILRNIFIIFVLISSISLLLASFSHYKQYRGNKVRRRPKKVGKKNRY